MARIVPFTKNREVIYDLLKRARRNHCTCSSQHHIDVTRLMNVLDHYRATGNPVTMNACLIRATSLLLRRFPRLNHHLFHGVLRKYEVDFEQICCNVIMLRRDGDELVLLPLLIERSDQLTVQEIDEVLEFNKRTPLQELPQVQGMQKLKRMPRLAIKAFSFMARSNHRFYRKFFGTYGYSTMLMDGKDGLKLGHHGIASQSAANTCTGFLPCSVSEKPVVVEGEIVVRKILELTMLMDHYLVDGHDVLRATAYLTELLSDPALLGLTEPVSTTSATAASR